MSQRIRRAQDRKNGATMATGGHVVHHNRGEDPTVRIEPSKATGDVKDSQSQNFAKASPFFKKLEEVVKPDSKAEEKRVIAEASKPVIEADKKDSKNKAN